MPARATGSAGNAGRSRTGLLLTVVSAIRTALRPGTPGLGERGRAVPRMVGAVLRREYRGASVRHLALLALAVVYVVSPLDLVPEGVLGLVGLTDDAVLVTWLAATLVHDTEDFLAWEHGRGVGGSDPRGAAGGPQDAPQDAAAGPSRRGRGGETVSSHVVR